MRLRIENARTKVVHATEDELDWLRQYLTFQDMSKMFMARKFGRGSGMTCMLDRRGPSFPSGLVPLVVRAAAKEYAGTDGGRFDHSLDDIIEPDPKLLSDEDEEFRVVIEDDREAPCEWDWQVDLEWLYDHQYEPVWQFGHRTPRGLLKVPTGGGKTEFAVGLMMALPCNWVFLVDSMDLVLQSAKRWRQRTGLECGVIGDGEWEPDPTGRATFSTFQSLYQSLDAVGIVRRKLEKFEAGKNKTRPTDEQIKRAPELQKRAREVCAQTEGLIVDEAHTLAADTFTKVVMNMRRAYYRVGMSATPLDRGDKRSIVTVGSLGPIVYEVPVQELIDKGFLARPNIYVLKHKEEVDSSQWQTSYKKIIVEGTEYNSLILDIVSAAAKPTIVFVEQQKHGKELLKHVRTSGFSAEFVWGEKDTKQRAQAIKNVERAETEVLITSRVFQKGIDIPVLRSVVNAAGMRSTIAALQRIGRGMRTDQGKKSTFEVWDVKVEGDRFMARHSNERLRAYKREGHEIEILRRTDLAKMRDAQVQGG